MMVRCVIFFLSAADFEPDFPNSVSSTPHKPALHIRKSKGGHVNSKFWGQCENVLKYRSPVRKVERKSYLPCKYVLCSVVNTGLPQKGSYFISLDHYKTTTWPWGFGCVTDEREKMNEFKGINSFKAVKFIMEMEQYPWEIIYRALSALWGLKVCVARGGNTRHEM